MHALRFGLASLVCLALSCTGNIDDPDNTFVNPSNSAHGRTGSASEACEAGVQAARSPFRRLRQHEYNNAVRDLLGDTTRPADRFPTTSSEAVGFEVSVSPVQYELYADVSRELAEAADLDALVSCDDVAESACADRFITDVGLRVFRRPVNADSRERLTAVYEVGARTNHEHGLRLVLSAMLQSPNFLYLAEVSGDGTEGDIVPLDSYERASRLSFLLWESTPDEELLRAAGADELASAEQVATQVARMLEDDRAQETLLSFHRDWLHLDLESVSLDGYDDEVVRAMETETEKFIHHVLFESEGTLDELMTAKYTFLNEDLAEIYGIEGVSGDEFVRVDLDPSERAGILTHPSFLAHTASEGSAAPVFRGKFVTEQFLCQLLPEAPNEIPPFSRATGDTQRERLAAHRENADCAACHVLMDPIGFGFENYDSVGRYRSEDVSGPVDATGELSYTIDSDGTFDGAIELSDRLSTSEDLRQCMNTQWFRFALRRLEGASDVCSLRTMDEAFARNDYDLLSIVVSLTQTDAFLNRRVGGQIDTDDASAEDSP